MSIKFSEHASNQTKRRNISKIEVIKTIRNPDKIIASFRGRKLRRRLVSSKILEVVTRTEGSEIIVITAYYLEENL
ncbi:hypothetical protein A3D00_03515 [Candidatus Woesebacteria bacterium RIFCSPHIGHO2_02_FULL_38_9]|uniref:DUF4258 domain-containing protein n=1 Tax=Candidatus Woesebacteria bacterium RIFCSPHIGHO2_01_FULL_39_28 TaxID=1802496 RepID=A0A1F7YGS2_9BACT|nr:MAG: hypothetical protein A2627_00770 [Candidatus Woesebacteria bacterium RIFCSPHIGHO2_01_FULL_39_28]OGM32566.1 MAG: hypothetical protein A3D00_03515 [Candidatus Woesebacteria bacterium RIFCSPHIGHO2_02_FULL_38_9]OGM58747.1 MAG: hypothetical protein A3A50_03090 [Candidatus Woesebacteria bacterium RIFCSPLOWO2_01_FULL_38_20]